MGQRSIHDWLSAYGESHQDPTNKAVHWICVPVIYFCVVAFLWSIPDPPLSWVPGHLWAKAAIALVAVFYFRLSFTLMLGMVAWSACCLWACRWLDMNAPWPLWSIALVLFVAAWIGQFIGHKVEGRKPSFLDDLHFLMIGPAWLMSFLYRRLGIAY